MEKLGYEKEPHGYVFTRVNTMEVMGPLPEAGVYIADRAVNYRF